VKRILTAALAAGVILLAACAPGKSGGRGGSTSMAERTVEKVFVDINGSRQGMFITSTGADKPVLLFVHGGIGMPEFFLDEIYPTGLEKLFTVCWWERRGAGLSYRPGMPAAEISVDQYVADTLAVTDWLARRYGQERITLMAHSGGTFIALQAAARAPQKYTAYVAVAQITDQAESERLTYRFMLDEYARRGNAKAVRRLQQFPVLTADTDTLLSYFFSMARDASMHELGVGTMHAMRSVITGVFLPSLRCRAYTLRERLNIWRGKAFLQKSTSFPREIMTTDLARKVPRLAVPVYFVSGAHDQTVSPLPARQYLAALEAPVKGFYTIADSAHSPMFEQPEVFLRVMSGDVLRGKADLADRD
jgi:pimeloyl-ACP methyl ester carboxylesterase